MRRLFCLLALAALLLGLPATGAAYGGGTQDERYPQVIPSAQFAALVADKLEANLAETGETRRHELKLVRAPMDMRCPPGELTSEVRLPRQIRYSGLNPVNIFTYIDGKLFRRVTCYYRVVVYDRVLVANHDLSLEKPITAKDVRQEEREIAERGEEYLTDLATLEGQVPARVIREGTIITANMLRPPIVMEAGAPITLLAKHGEVQVKTEGVAVQRGRPGAIIRVRNARSGKVLRGRVIDATTVEIL